jgi:hypothetical protein
METIRVRRLKEHKDCLRFDDILCDVVGAPRFTYDLSTYGVTQDMESDTKYFFIHVEDDELAARLKLAIQDAGFEA